MPKTYSKKFRTLPEQINLLKKRGLTFSDENKAKVSLIRKNYFDVINGFETLLLKDPKAINKEYNDGTLFEHFDELYKFDKQLSSILFKAIDSFENRLKTSIAYRFGEAIYNVNPSANPASYIDILMYENPFSIHNRINNLLPGNPSETVVIDLNFQINKFINGEIANLQNKLIKLNGNSIQYISSKTRARLLRAKDGLNNSITNMNRVINQANRKISSTSPSSHTGTNINNISQLSTTLTTSFTKVPPSNPSKIESDIQVFIETIQELKIRVNKVFSQVAANSNTAIHTEPHQDLKNFVGHNLFKTNYDKDKNYIDYMKSRYGYLQTYEVPPFWVIIKTLELGSVLKLMYGLKTNILDKIVEDMGLLPTERHILFNSTKIIIDFRNHCAHFGLVNRYRTKQNIRINTDLINKLGLRTKSNGHSHYEIRLYDTLLVLSQFTSLKEVSDLFKDFFMSSDCLVNSTLLMKLLNRMGNDNFLNWCDF